MHIYSLVYVYACVCVCVFSAYLCACDRCQSVLFDYVNKHGHSVTYLSCLASVCQGLYLFIRVYMSIYLYMCAYMGICLYMPFSPPISN